MDDSKFHIHLVKEKDKNFPPYLSLKREIMSFIKGLKEAFEEERNKRMKQILYESCPMEVIKYNAGFLSALSLFDQLLDDKAQELKKE